MKKNVRFDTAWRRSTIAIYRPPVDSRTYGTLDVDVTYLMEYLDRKKQQGVEMTLTQVVASALGRAMGVDVPELNAYVKRGKVVPRDSVDVFIAVNIPGINEMTGFSVRKIDQKRLNDISKEIRDRVERARAKMEQGATKNKNMLSKIPWPFRTWVFKLIRFISVGLAMKMKFIGVDPSSFGSAMLSNIGTYGLQYGFAALLPASNLPIVIIMGAAQKKPVVIDDKIVIRTMLPIAGTFDHRIVDGSQGGKLAKAVSKYLEQPELLENGAGKNDD
jgi:pyruvate dehydrogenase E2 component (dihydrolipoamide acetyltransferase)